MSVRIQITGLDEAVRKMGATEAEIPEMKRRILTKAAITGENEGKLAAPVDTGRLRSSITHRVEGDAAMYGTNVPYGLYLDQPVTRNPHYRGGPRAGARTAGWLTDTLQKVSDKLQGSIIPGELRRIVDIWR